MRREEMLVRGATPRPFRRLQEGGGERRRKEEGGKEEGREGESR
tara:strand:+ start:523 stop:654 length:132 start_codon:yes stop_codon:yes gene_type:complete